MKKRNENLHNHVKKKSPEKNLSPGQKPYLKKISPERTLKNFKRDPKPNLNHSSYNNLMRNKMLQPNQNSQNRYNTKVGYDNNDPYSDNG